MQISYFTSLSKKKYNTAPTQLRLREFLTHRTVERVDLCAKNRTDLKASRLNQTPYIHAPSQSDEFHHAILQMWRGSVVEYVLGCGSGWLGVFLCCSLFLSFSGWVSWTCDIGRWNVGSTLWQGIEGDTCDECDFVTRDHVTWHSPESHQALCAPFLPPLVRQSRGTLAPNLWNRDYANQLWVSCLLQILPHPGQWRTSITITSRGSYWDASKWDRTGKETMYSIPCSL